MANLISKASGNFTNSATWGVADTTSAQLTNSTVSVLGTSYTLSTAFTPGAITIDGVAIYIALRHSIVLGTFSTALHQAGSLVTGTEVTINCADLPYITGYLTPAAGGGGIGWVFFKFPAPVTLTAATAYTLGCKCSISGGLSVRVASGTNYMRLLRTTTNQAPAAGDTLLILGEWTAPATVAVNTVTVDNTATTAFGTTEICNNGILTYGTAAATNYYLKTLDAIIRPAGIMRIGTSSVPIPATSTAVLEFASTSTAQYGLIVQSLGAFESFGVSKVFWTNLTVDAAAAATSFTVQSTADWAVGDEVVFTPTARTVAQHEKLSLLTIPTGTTFTTAATAYAHSGTPPIAGQVANVTRNVKVRGMTAVNTGYISSMDSAVFSASYTQFSFLGHASSPLKRGVSPVTTTGSFNLQYCSLYSFASGAQGIYINISNGANIIVNGCIIYHMSTNFAISTATLLTNAEFTNNLSIGGASMGADLRCADLVFTGNRICGAGTYGIYINYPNAVVTGTFNSNIVHSCSTNVNIDSNIVSMLFGSMTCYFGPTSGLTINTAQYGYGLVFDSWTMFGNGNYNVFIDTDIIGLVTFTNLISDSHATHTTATGISLGALSTINRLFILDSSIGVTVPHSYDFLCMVGDYNRYIQLLNTTLASPIEVSTIENLGDYSYIASYNHDNVPGAIKTQKRYGIITSDSSTMRLTPNNASSKLIGGSFKVAVAAGESITPSIKVRKSVIGDGAIYNGSQPRLILQSNHLAGFDSDAVIATATNAANGAYETISGSSPVVENNCILEFAVDCDGTTGWINVKEFDAESADTQDIWHDGEPTVLMAGSGSGSTIVLRRRRKVV